MKGVKLLILSRSKFFAEALKFILHNLVEDISVVHSPDRLTDLLRRRSYDVVICDMSCLTDGETNHLEYLKELSPGTHILLFSFDPPARHRELVERLGADGYINRPLDPETVIDAIKSLKISP